MAELCLGTVQFGMNYGINNSSGQPAEENVFEMLDTAIENGIRMFDTASAYGTSEILLGKYLKARKRKDPIRIVSKLRPNLLKDHEKDTAGAIRRELENTLERLQMDRLNGYLLHDAQDFYFSGVPDALRRLKEEKLVKHVGLSIYELRDGYAALDTDGLDYVQLPYSVLDQRGIQESFIPDAVSAGMTVFTRSAFLQGLLMMETERVPEHLYSALPYLQKLDELCEKYQVRKIDALIHFITDEERIQYLVFGVDTKEQLLQYIHIYQNGKIPLELAEELKKTFTNVEKEIIFPNLWSKNRKRG